MTSLNKVVFSLRREYSRLEKEVERVKKALEALGHISGSKLGTKRRLSREARRRIAEAQRRRWAKVRKQAA